ncbi:MAG: hypothetical protein ACRCZF_15170, partial [Gemmataceae bacterium]
MNETGITRESEFVLRRLAEPFPFVPIEASTTCWWILTVALLLIGFAFTITMYVRDCRTIRWFVAAPLAFLRMLVYVLLAVAFLLPAQQTWEKVEKRSKVLVLLDVSPSVTQVTDDVASAGGPKAKTRLQKILDTFADTKLNLFGKIIEKNPITVYRFGSRLDENGLVLDGTTPPWSPAEWAAWAQYDFKPGVLRGLSDAGQKAVAAMTAWDGTNPGTADWAMSWMKKTEAETIPVALTPEDRTIIVTARAQLEKRLEIARAVVGGTNVADSATAAINREVGNMVQGIILFSDGRSNLGTEAGLRELRDRATREKVPLFTVAVG